MFSIVVALIGVALFFDYINGFHDAANSIATVVSTRVLSPGKAVIWAAFFNFVAAFTFGTAVASTVGSGMIDIHVVTFAVVFGGLTGAIVWDLITWYFGLPTSSSHALIGGYAGAAVAKAGFSAIILAGWTKTIIFIFLSPLIGLTAGLVLMTSIFWLFRGMPPRRVDVWFRKLQLLSAAFFSLNRLHRSVSHPVLGCAGGARGHRARHARGRLAHHPHDGIEDHEAAASGRLCGRDGCGDCAPDRHLVRRAREHDACDYRIDCRGGRHQAPVSGAVGRRRADCLGLGPDDSSLVFDCGGDVSAAARSGREVTSG
jgi:hypothetical protein